MSTLNAQSYFSYSCLRISVLSVYSHLMSDTFISSSIFSSHSKSSSFENAFSNSLLIDLSSFCFNYRILSFSVISFTCIPEIGFPWSLCLFRLVDLFSTDFGLVVRNATFSFPPTFVSLGLLFSFTKQACFWITSIFFNAFLRSFC